MGGGAVPPGRAAQEVHDEHLHFAFPTCSNLLAPSLTCLVLRVRRRRAAVLWCRVVVLDCAPLSSFVSTASSTPEPPLLFALQTTASPPLPAPLRPLPPPNLLHSLASAVLVHCELEALPATLLVSYASPHFIVESLLAYRALQPLLVGSSPVRPVGSRDAAAAWKETVHGLSRQRGGTAKGIGGAASSLLHGPSPDLFV